MSEGPLVCYKELLSPTNIEKSAFFYCYNNIVKQSEEYLCILTISTISLYKVIDDSLKSNKILSLKLHQKFFGKSNDIEVLKDIHKKNDILIITLDITKVLVLRYNLLMNTFDTLLLHNVDENSYGIGSDLHLHTSGMRNFLGTGNECHVRVCQENALVCSVIYGSYLMFISLASLQSVSNNNHKLSSDLLLNIDNSESIKQHFAIHLTSTLNLPGPILDLCFLNGFSRPTIAILQEPGLLPIGHSARVRHTCAVTVLAIDTLLKSASILWQQTDLPSDCISLLQLSNPIFNGSIAVISLNALLVVNQSEIQGIAMNGFAATTVKLDKIGLQPWISNQYDGIELDASRWINDDTVDIVVDTYQSNGRSSNIIGILKDGKMLSISITLGVDEQILSSIKFTLVIIANSSKLVTTLSRSSDGSMWFIGSRQTESLLINVNRSFLITDSETALKTKHSYSKSSFLSSNCKRIRNLSEHSGESKSGEFDLSESELFHVMSLEEHEFYESNLPSIVESSYAKQYVIKYQISILDSIKTLGPILDGIYTSSDTIFNNMDSIDWERSNNHAIGSSTHTHTTSFILERESKDGLILSSGLDEGGALLRIHQGLYVDKLASRTIIGATHVFSIPTLNFSHRKYNILLISYETKSRILHCQIEADINAVGIQERPELQVKELPATESGFICTGSTLNVGILQENNAEAAVIAQITPQGIRILRLANYGQAAEAIQDVLLSDSPEVGGLGGVLGETIICGDVCIGYVSLLTSFQTLFVLYYNALEDCMDIVIKRSNTNGLEDVSPLQHILTSTVVSVSLYHGVFDVITDDSQSNEIYQNELSSANKNLTTEKEKEELFIYGQVLSEELVDPIIGNVIMETEESSNEIKNEIDLKQNEVQSEVFLIITELNNSLSVIRMRNLSSVIKTNEFAKLNSFIAISNEKNIVNNNKLYDKIESESRIFEGMIIETKIARLSEFNNTLDTNQSFIQNTGICISLLLHTGELIVYSSCETNQKVYGFQKVDQYTITNKRTNDNKLYRSVSNDSTINDHIANDNLIDDFSSYIITNDYLKRYGPTFSYSEDFNNRSCILVGGNEPLVVTTIHGLISIIPIGFPELPCINYGHCSVVPFSMKNNITSTTSVKAIATLWFEWEDIQSTKAPSVFVPSNLSRSTKESYLGIYQEVPSLELYPGSSISVKRVNVGKTIHKISEILNKTGDRTQQALLEKKTIALACSEESLQPFIPNVFTQEEIEQDGELYERYFSSFESFCQPDLSYGKPPLILERKHSLSLLQLGINIYDISFIDSILKSYLIFKKGSVVDTYALPKNEYVVDMEVLYFNLEKSTTIPGMLLPLKTLEQRVFLSVCTSVIDKRGEDTTGDGRLLLFGIDYAMFDQEDELHSTVVDDHAKEEISNASEKLEGDIDILKTKVSDPPVTNPNPLLPTGGVVSVAQAKFLGSIKPKLKLLWHGPGPGSVVKQLGEFVLSTVGSTVYIYRFNHDTVELEQVTFYYAQLYITSVSIVKNYVILADMHHSIQLLVWRPEDMTLNFISKDYDYTVVPHTSYLIDATKLGIVTTDDECNIQIFQQNAKNLESIKGSRLLCIADMHLGSEVTSLLTHELLTTENIKKQGMLAPDHRPPPPPPTARTRKGSTFQLQKFGTRLNKTASIKKTTSLITTVDGSIGLILPMEERMYKRLVLLQQIMTMTIPTLFSLNPREYRLFKSMNIRITKKKGILDGCILWRFTSLPPSIQDQLAATVGATSYLIKENLHEIDYLTRFF